MHWYKFKQGEEVQLRYLEDVHQEVLKHFRLKHWKVSWQQVHIRPLRQKHLTRLLQELLQGMKSGLSVQELLHYLSVHSQYPSLRLTCQAFIGELSAGVAFNITLKRLTDKSLHSYCDLFVDNSTPEQLQKSLTLMAEQLQQLTLWSKQLVNTLIYPFSVAQLALVMWILHRMVMPNEADNLLLPVGCYLSVTLVQVFILYCFQNGTATLWLEYSSRNFRLNKVFGLLTAAIESGTRLQTALAKLPDSFGHFSTKTDLNLIYYHLRLGRSYSDSFPQGWFPAESLIALTASHQTGDIRRALIMAAAIHRRQWETLLERIKKIAPAISLLLSGVLVARLILEMYRPMMELG